MEKYSTLRNKKEFDNFLSNKSEYLQLLARIINKERLTFDENEVKKISNYFINKNKNKTLLHEDKLIFITYLGEFLIYNYKGEWFFTGSKDDFSPNEPYIGKSEAILIRECPSDSINAILTTENENYFIEKLENNIKKKKDINDVFSKIFPTHKKNRVAFI